MTKLPKYKIAMLVAMLLFHLTWLLLLLIGYRGVWLVAPPLIGIAISVVYFFTPMENKDA